MKNFYKKKILLSRNVVESIVDDILRIKGRVLVFGLGYDTELWFNANGRKDIWFIEENEEYIKLNPDIPSEYIIHHRYEGINVNKSLKLEEKDLVKYNLPKRLDEISKGGFDLIIIDGPTGYAPGRPGRMLSVYWSVKKWSNRGTVFYLDDTNRTLERRCIDLFLGGMEVSRFENKSSTIRFVRGGL